MNKYGWLFLSITISILITIISQEVAGLTANGITDGLAGTLDFNADTIIGFFETYVGLLTFNVVGIPAVISLFFIPLNLVIGIILLELLIKAIEAIIPL